MAQRPAPPCEEPLLPAFYSGRSVLVTGASGFMGKVLVERLLTTCPGVGRLYLLLRSKRDLTPQDRLHQLKQSQVFEGVRARCPLQLEKLRVVAGDTALPELGVTQHALLQLQEVSVVFHTAATLKFDEGLAAAVDQNVRSVIRLMDLCDRLPHLQALVHVSTAYAHTERARLEERVYPPPVPLADLLALVEALPADLQPHVTPQYIRPKPNTYTFTKAMAENAVEQRKDRRYPVAIFRPSIVISASRHPFPGWIDNLNGPSGVVAGAGTGLLQVLSCREEARADLVPVDIAIDTLLAVAWECATDASTEVRVYNCSSVENPTTWRELKHVMFRTVREHPFNTTVWYPFGFTTESTRTQRAAEWALQTVPLLSADFVARLVGLKMKVRLATACGRLRAMDQVFRFFALREWHFCNDNVVRLRERLSLADAAIYNLDPRTIRWEEHYEQFVRGVRRYLLQERDEDIPRARRHMTRLWMAHQTVVWGGAALLLRLLLPRLLQVLRLRSQRRPQHTS